LVTAPDQVLMDRGVADGTEDLGADSDGGNSSTVGWPGVSWRGDGALGAGRGQLRAMDPDQHSFPPAGDDRSGYPLATLNRRWVGFIIDELIVSALALVIGVVLGVLTSSSSEVVLTQTAVAATLLRVGYGLIFNPRGWSPGKRWMRLRIVRLDGEVPGLRYGVVRTAVAVISHDLFLIGYMWAALDPKVQTWHDKFAGTYVVRVDEGVEGETHVGWKRQGR